MKKSLVLIASVATLILVFQASVQADENPQKELDAARFFVGTWNCTHTEGSVSGRYTLNVVKYFDDKWLKQTYDFAATDSAPPFQGEWFMRYDDRVRHWVRFGALSDGMYFAMVGNRTNDTWSWSYVLPSPGATTIFVKKSDSEFTVDGPSYVMNGTPVSEHHVCQKTP